MSIVEDTINTIQEHQKNIAKVYNEKQRMLNNVKEAEQELIKLNNIIKILEAANKELREENKALLARIHKDSK